MKPRRTHSSNAVYEYEGGTEDNSLWVEKVETEDDFVLIRSVWEPTKEERALIATGMNIELTVMGAQPPVSMRITDVPLGKAPDADAPQG